MSAPSISSAFAIWATLRSIFSKSSNWIDVTFSIVLFGISCLLGFWIADSFWNSIFWKRIGAFLILSVLKIFEIFSADSGMKGERSFVICLIDSTN